MKKNFLRILPIAAAVLLATSCSKDKDDNTVVENNAAQETLKPFNEFTLTVSSGKSLSKLSLADELGGNASKNLKFDKGDVLNISFDGITYFSSSALTERHLSADGSHACFYFPEVDADTYSMEDVVSGYMGVYSPDEVKFVEFDNLKDAFSEMLRELNTVSWTLESSDNVSFIYMDENTTKMVIVNYYDDTIGDNVDAELEPAKAYYINPEEVTVTVESKDKELAGGKLYYVTE